jgi:hypothetical protein
MIFLVVLIFFICFVPYYRVERFVLIATTGKNAKTLIIPFSINQSSHLLFNNKLNFSQMGYLFTSESVSEGHPDKVADQISDALLDEFLRWDPESKVACETFVTTGLVVCGGEVSTTWMGRCSGDCPQGDP